MKRKFLFRLMALLLCLCLAPIHALGYGEVPVFTDPVTHADMDLFFDFFPEAFPDETTADLQGWAEFLDKLSFKGGLDVQNPLKENVRAWFDGGLYLNNVLTVPFQSDVYFTFRYMQSRAIRGESMFFKMENFFEFMMKFRYYMELPTNYIALAMYPEATLEMRDRFYTPLAELCKGTGDRVVAYDDLYDLCLSWEDMYMNDGEDYYKLYYFLTCLLNDLGVNYDVYDQIGMITDWLNVLDPEGAGLSITAKDGVETYTIGKYEVFTSQLDSPRTFTLALPDEHGNLLTVTSKDTIKDGWGGDDWLMGLNITLAPEEEESEGEVFLDLTLDMRDIPIRQLYQTSGVITLKAEGSALKEPVKAKVELDFQRTDIVYPNETRIAVSPHHPQTDQKMMTINLVLRLSEVPYTVLQERVYPQEDFFHLNEEYLQRVKENYLPSLAVSFLPVVAEMPAGVINDVVRFADDAGILVSLGVE